MKWDEKKKKRERKHPKDMQMNSTIFLSISLVYPSNDTPKQTNKYEHKHTQP